MEAVLGASAVGQRRGSVGLDHLLLVKPEVVLPPTKLLLGFVEEFLDNVIRPEVGLHCLLIPKEGEVAVKPANAGVHQELVNQTLLQGHFGHAGYNFLGQIDSLHRAISFLAAMPLTIFLFRLMPSSGNGLVPPDRIKKKMYRTLVITTIVWYNNHELPMVDLDAPVCRDKTERKGQLPN